ncbi:MAG TPA: DNA polymerase III subunit gamma/tau C-terminal domain-containing protein, partial [Stenotrophomonas sp.]
PSAAATPLPPSRPATAAPARAAQDDPPPWVDDAPVRTTPVTPEMAMAPPPVAEPPASESISAAIDGRIADAEQWLELIARAQLSGPSRQLAAHAAFVSHREGVLRLALDPGFEYLRSERSLGELAQALQPALGQAPKIVIEAGQASVETLHQRTHRQKNERQDAAEAAFLADPSVQRLIQQHGARVVPDSIRPYEE